MAHETPNRSMDANDLRRGALQSLDHLRRMGIGYLPLAEPDVVASIADKAMPSHSSRAESASQDVAEQRAEINVRPASKPPPVIESTPNLNLHGSQGAYASEPLPITERRISLDQLKAHVQQCRQCHELACTRKQTVFGEGNPQARVCFFGEAPGADEDRQGVPFVGRAGQLLTKIIEATKLRREDVYILNTIKCRPPDNRNPLPEELANCRHYFEKQFEIIQPEYIVCLGLFAAQSLLATKLSIGKMRGQFHHYLGSKVLVTYHPAYLLRNEKMKGATWQDMQMLMRDMGTL